MRSNVLLSLLRVCTGSLQTPPSLLLQLVLVLMLMLMQQLRRCRR